MEPLSSPMGAGLKEFYCTYFWTVLMEPQVAFCLH